MIEILVLFLFFIYEKNKPIYLRVFLLGRDCWYPASPNEVSFEPAESTKQEII